MMGIQLGIELGTKWVFKWAFKRAFKRAFNLGIQSRHSIWAFNLGIQTVHSIWAFNQGIQSSIQTLSLDFKIELRPPQLAKLTLPQSKNISFAGMKASVSQRNEAFGEKSTLFLKLMTVDLRPGIADYYFETTDIDWQVKLWLSGITLNFD
jgi:hypothetical protein